MHRCFPEVAMLPGCFRHAPHHSSAYARHALVLLMVVVFGHAGVAYSADTAPVFISGHEVSAGASCVVAGQTGTCGAAFGGWIGGGGPIPNGWGAFSGGPIAWAVIVNYTGTSGLGRTV